MQLSIILPARNEELLIKGALRDISSFLAKRKISDYEILVIINGTTDNTEKLVLAESNSNKKIKIIHSDPGYGKALKKG
jgi:glycosyltransferase involved in cell wall biosynthesis